MDRQTMTQNNNTDIYSVELTRENLRMFTETEPLPTYEDESGSEDEFGSDDESDSGSDESGSEDEDEAEDESEDESEEEDDNDYDSDRENYDEIRHVHQLIRDELDQTDDDEKVEKKIKAFEKWLPSVQLENYEFSSNGTNELWVHYLVDQWYADPNDTGDEEDAFGNLLRHKRAKERRVDIRFDKRVVS
jgi:hypothetical protein